MAKSYNVISDFDTHIIVFQDPSTEELPIPLAMFPKTFPEDMVKEVATMLNTKDPDGKIAADTEAMIEQYEASAPGAEMATEFDVSPNDAPTDVPPAATSTETTA